MMKHHNEEKLAAQLNIAEINRIKDLDDIKTQFYTNLSHEFRTPLSLILGPLNQAKKSIQASSIADENSVEIKAKTVSILHRNAERLQNLVDQLLDLSKIESGKLKLDLTKGNIIGFIRAVVFSFESMAERQNISYNTNFPSSIPEAYYDKDKLEKILSNLLSNAFKYTGNRGAVSVSVKSDTDYISIEVSDTGMGIDENEVKHIFDRFYRVEGSEEKGSGIGLALTKELVELLNGQIHVNSTKGQGTSFKVRIPTKLNILSGSNDAIEENLDEDFEIERESEVSQVTNDMIASNTMKTQNLPLVLIVEDNEDLRMYISEVVGNHYKVMLAKDGMQGERMAFEHIPDVIITDVMMPKKDGFEMCQSLKTNVKTSHIPIIMLTAKAGHNNKMAGLTQGADAYLTKPFNDEELLLRMQNLIESRKKIWDYLKSSDLLFLEDLPVGAVDDGFLKRVMAIIKQNLDNEYLSVDDVAKKIGFSKTQLYRKLKALCNKSTNQLIVEVRLNEAKRMLESNEGNVSEVAYSVGYSNMSYFTKSFKEKFGVLPSKIGIVKTN
jgi:DNA-binding response OmpR family regulator/nitrogen-specific signal transduction histidine kinase